MIDDNLIPLAGIAIPIIIVPTVLAFRHQAKKREMDHIERMKALETGQSLPTRTAWPAAVVGTAIGAGVPIAAFFFTWLASVTTQVDNEIWMAPAVVGVFGVIVGGKLATRLLRPAQPDASETTPGRKPAMDPDAYDVAGRRG